MVVIARILVVIAATWALLGPLPATANRLVGGWSAAGIANQTAANVRLMGKKNEVIYTVDRLRVVRVVEVLSRLEKSAGVTAELFVVHYEDNQPNAFAAGRSGRNMVGITPAMLELIQDDFDACAAVLGHELAHLVKQHGADREARQGLLQGLGLIASLLIGARTCDRPVEGVRRLAFRERANNWEGRAARPPLGTSPSSSGALPADRPSTRARATLRPDRLDREPCPISLSGRLFLEGIRQDTGLSCPL